MDIYSIIERLRPHCLPILVGLAGMIFLIYGFGLIVQPRPEEAAMQFEANTAKSEAKPTMVKKQITIDIEGAVQKPGVYQFSSEARVQDVLLAAGGLASNADREKIAKGLNLASKVPDGGKIYIPTVGDPAGSAMAGAVSGDAVLGASTGTTNLNTATAKELDSLPGVGEVTAQKIINNRPYSASDDLVSKKVVSQKVYSQIKDKVTAY